MKRNPYKEELKLARSQRRRLQTMLSRLNAMSFEWAELHGGLECDFSRLADEIEPQIQVMNSQIKEWAEGLGDKEEEKE